jgi:Carboxypeptidase regulatory-like domain/TonB-dependent Receptor Plug Domain/TonB dependent receptor
MLKRLTQRQAWLGALAILALFFAGTGRAAAQNPTGTISGHVSDSSGLGVPGVTVTAESRALQGVRSTTTSENGDYIFPFVPPGTYTISFELTGFGTQKKSFDVAAAQTVPLNVTLSPAVTEQVTVSARSDAFVNTPTVASSVKAELTDTLPTQRTLNAAVNLAPGLHGTGPSGNITVAGAMSFDNVIMLNGVQITDNLRGTPFNLFIEDAIQETTVSTAGISAEYGRFAGGVVNAITKSGGNQFSGSFRTTFTNDKWRALTPFTGDKKVDKVVPAYEYTAGGPILRDRTWFFTAGRLQNNETANTTAAPVSLPYTFGDDEKRFEGKVTQTIMPGHTARVAYTNIREAQTNYGFSTFMDTRSLIDRDLPQNLLSVNYNGVLSPSFFIEGQYSSRHYTFKNAGAPTTDLIDGTLLLDRQRSSRRYWSPTFCGICGDEKRDNDDILVKGNYFASTGNGSHNVVFGYDTFNDKRFANNHQSGSDYRIYGTTSILQNGVLYPVFDTGQSTYIQYNPIIQATTGTNFRTHSIFANDTWRFGTRLSANLGIRWDKNVGRDGANNLVADDAAFSPRVGVVWDARGDGKISVTASFARYVSAINNSIADSSSPGGQAATFQWYYNGPKINVDASQPLVPTDVALRTLFNWFNSVGGQNLRPFRGVDIPGVATKINGSLDSPHANEFSTGVAFQLGTRGSARVDYIHRQYADFYIQHADSTTGSVVDEFGQEFDLKLIENGNGDFSRKYDALQTSVNYRLYDWISLGGNYTLSHLRGTVDGENVASGPLTSDISYPEFFQFNWTFPEGDLSADQRHRLRLWQTVTVPMRESWGHLSVGLLEQFESGTPYGALGVIDTSPYSTDPGYSTPPTAINYYFTPRDAFHTEALYRTDLATNYSHRIVGHSEVFVVAHVLNLFNQFSLYNINSIDQSVLTASNSAGLTSFNPFASQPVQGTNWNLGPNFGKAATKNAYGPAGEPSVRGRTFRFAVGFRF